MSVARSRREFLQRLGISAAALPFVMNLPSVAAAAPSRRKQRMIIMFSPNGVVPGSFWPAKEGEDFAFPESLQPLEPFHDRTLILRGVCNKVSGDGDNHMRGMSCLLTGIELFPGNVQGGSKTPAGWASGISIDQEIKNHLQQDEATRTRFGSLEFGVLVPERADPWSRMVYSGPNKPVAPIDDAYQMFGKLYGAMQDRESLGSVLDDLTDDLKRVSQLVSAEDRRQLDEQAEFILALERSLRDAGDSKISHPMPELEKGVVDENDNMPLISKLQIDMLVNSFANDFARVATLQYTNSVGGARMKWIGVDENHHTLSHEPDSNAEAHAQLAKIDYWFCEQLAYLTQQLVSTPEPGGEGSLLDNTLVVWTNELGKGNSHSRDDIPFVLVGGGLDFRMGRYVKFDQAYHNRLLMSLAHGFGHHITTFGNRDYCGAGPLLLS